MAKSKQERLREEALRLFKQVQAERENFGHDISGPVRGRVQGALKNLTDVVKRLEEKGARVTREDIDVASNAVGYLGTFINGLGELSWDLLELRDKLPGDTK